MVNNFKKRELKQAEHLNGPSIDKGAILKLRLNDVRLIGPLATRRGFSREIGISDHTLCALELGERINPSFHTIIKYCVYFGVSPYELMRESVGRELWGKFIDKMVREANLPFESGEILKNHFSKGKTK